MGNASNPATPASSLPTGTGSRRRWFDLHSWIGLKLCVFMGFICLTGTLAVLAQEIDWLLHPPMRVVPRASTVGWDTLIASAQQAHPQWTLDSLTAPHASRFAAMAVMRTPHGRLRLVWIDPYTGRVTGDTHWFGAHRFLRNTHRHLMLPVKYGVPLVAALSLPLLLSLATSLVIYKRWWRGFLKRPRPERPRRLWGDVHRLLGVWSLWFIALIGLTGGWYLVESLGGKATPPAGIALQQGPSARAMTDPGAVRWAMAEVRQRWPQLGIGNVRPTRDGRGLLIEGQAQAWLVRDRANAVGVDLRQRRVLALRDGRDMSLHQRIAEMADPLHFGSFGGWPIRVLWFVFGAALTMLCFTGAYLYGLRIADALRSALRRSTAAQARA